MRRLLALTAASLLAAPLATPLAAQTPLLPGVLLFGDVDRLGFGFADPAASYAGATLVGLLPGQTSMATTAFMHGYPFAPETGADADFAGTDQIFTAAGQSATGDGYSQYAGAVRGANTLSLDYGSLVPTGHRVTSFTLGIAADDFQRPLWGQPFTVHVNGAAHAGLTALLNGIDQTGPLTRFHSIGLDVALLTTGPLAITIAQNGDGRDGWAIDYLTVGIETQPIATTTPEPATATLAAAGLLGLGLVARRRRAPR